MLSVVFNESLMSRTQFQLCYNRFKDSQESVNANACPRRPNTSINNKNIDAMKKMILDNNRVTIREVADDIGISFDS